MFLSRLLRCKSFALDPPPLLLVIGGEVVMIGFQGLTWWSLLLSGCYRATGRLLPNPIFTTRGVLAQLGAAGEAGPKLLLFPLIIIIIMSVFIIIIIIISCASCARCRCLPA